MPRVSVVMPVHNGMPFLKESVESILGQSFQDFELVIGDDGSDDGSTDFLLELARSDDRVRLARRDSKSGVAGSFNWVTSLARAPLIAIGHADDVMHPDRLRRQVEVLDARPDASAVGCLSNGIDARGRVVQPASYWRLIRSSAFAPFAHSTLMMRREHFEEVGGYREEAEYWEDLDLYWRLREVGPVLVITKVLSSYRHSAVSIRSRDAQEGVENALELMYQSAARYAQGQPHDELLGRGAAAVAARRKVHPRIFVAQSWTSVWSGQRPDTLGRMLQRADLRADRSTFISVAFVLAASVSPRSLRFLVRCWNRAGGVLARRRLGGQTIVNWEPLNGGRTDVPEPS